MPLVVCGCFASGVMLTVFWPKLGRVLAFSAVGTLMFVAGGVIAVATARPEWLAYFPAASQTQGVALAVLVTAGAALQWSMLPGPVKPANAPREAAESRKPFRPRDVNDLGRPGVGRMKLTEARA
jgi:hypothetical protein